MELLITLENVVGPVSESINCLKRCWLIEEFWVFLTELGSTERLLEMPISKNSFVGLIFSFEVLGHLHTDLLASDQCIIEGSVETFSLPGHRALPGAPVLETRKYGVCKCAL